MMRKIFLLHVGVAVTTITNTREYLSQHKFQNNKAFPNLSTEHCKSVVKCFRKYRVTDSDLKSYSSEKLKNFNSVLDNGSSNSIVSCTVNKKFSSSASFRFSWHMFLMAVFWTVHHLVV